MGEQKRTRVSFVDTEGLELVNNNVISSLGQNKQTSQVYPSYPQFIVGNCYVPSYCTSLGWIRSPNLIRGCVLNFIKVNVFNIFALKCHSFSGISMPLQMALGGVGLFKCLYSYVSFVVVPVR